MPPSEKMELAASYVAIITLSANILRKTAEWVHGAKRASDAKGDLFSKVSHLHSTLEAINSSVKIREQQMNATAFGEEERKILTAIIRVLERCEQSVEDFSKTLESFSRERETGWFQNAMLQLKLDIKGPVISNFEKSVDANLASLQVLMSCLAPFMHEETQMLQRTGERNTEKYLDNIYQEILRVSELLAHDVSRPATPETAPLDETARNVTDNVPVGLEDEQPDIKTMRETVEVAESFVNTLSRAGSEVDSGGSGGSITDYRQRGTRSTARRDMVENGESKEGGFNPSKTDPEVLTRKASILSPEILIALFDDYQKQAYTDIRSENYKNAEFNLKKAIEFGEQREAGHAFPFEERFELQKSLAGVYTKLNKFCLAKKELRSLEAHAQHDPRMLAGVFCSFADMYRAEYHHTGDDRLLEHWECMAQAALRPLPEVSDQNPSDVLTQSANMLVELYKLKGDAVAERIFRTHYRTSEENRTETRLTIPDPQRNLTPEQPPLPTRPAPSFPAQLYTPPPSSASDAVSDAHASQNLLEFVEKGQVEATQVSLECRKNIDLERTNSSRLTPLLLAAKKKNTPMVRLFLGRSDIHARDGSGQNVLHHALRGFPVQNDMIQSLVDYHADVNAVDNKGRSPLHYCVDFNEHAAAQILIDNGADIEAKNLAGETPAMQAVKKTNMDELITLFYHAGAYFDMKRIEQLPKKDSAILLDRLARSKQSPAGGTEGAIRNGSITSHRSSVGGIGARFASSLKKLKSHQ